MSDPAKTILNRQQIDAFLLKVTAAVTSILSRYSGDGTDVKIIRGVPAELTALLADEQTLTYDKVTGLVEIACDNSCRVVIGRATGMADTAASVLTSSLQSAFLEVARASAQHEK